MSFSWAPFYREVAERVLEYEDRQSELLALLHEMKNAGLKTTFLEDNMKDGSKSPLNEMDPFTFLGNFSRVGDSEAAQLCAWLKKKWDLSVDSPEIFDGRVNVSAQNPWFFASTQNGRSSEDVPLLWQLAQQTFDAKVSDLDPKLFERCLQIVNIAPKKLTTGMSWFSPFEFLSLAGPILPYLKNQGVNFDQKKIQKGDLDEYAQLLQSARSVDSNYASIAHDAWNWNQEGRPDNETAITTRTEERNSNSSLPDFPLNQILYGPPGTGKTYSTIERAVEIIDGVAVSSHAAAKTRFEALRKNGQIEFVTFHQSFSYEEFIEGLRPILDEDGEGQARYEVRDGVLKTLALRALGSSLEKATERNLTFDQIWNALLEEIESDPKYVISGLSSESSYSPTLTGAGNLQGINVQSDKGTLYSCPRRHAETVWNAWKTSPKITSTQVKQSIGNSHTNFIGAVVVELKRINTQLQKASSVAVPPLEKTAEAAQSFLNSSPDYRANFSKVSRYVLIVDEINRGNISKILGELITLLEPDKRIGVANELRVQLPVSGETFALPPNLYLLGTMNTADKSLALLDIALRRRFDFIEMAPDNSLFPDFAREVLTQLNLRLEVALDREHRIGHAYFIHCENEGDFNAVFRAKIIPLLQEFFYNDWETLRAVLGEIGDKNGAFIVKLEAPAGMKARTKWRWWFDVDGATNFDFLDKLKANYN